MVHLFRLASKLIGWELDIRTKAAVAEAAAKFEAAKEAAKPAQEPVVEEKKAKKEKKKKKEEVSLEELSGLGEKTLASLKESGINTIADLLEAKVEGLTKIKGIGEKKAQNLIAQAKGKK